MLDFRFGTVKRAIGAINNKYNHDSKFNYLDRAHITNRVIGIVVKFYMLPRNFYVLYYSFHFLFEDSYSVGVSLVLIQWASNLIFEKVWFLCITIAAHRYTVLTRIVKDAIIVDVRFIVSTLSVY